MIPNKSRLGLKSQGLGVPDRKCAKRGSEEPAPHMAGSLPKNPHTRKPTNTFKHTHKYKHKHIHKYKHKLTQIH